MRKTSKAQTAGELRERQIIITPYSINGEIYSWHVIQYGESVVCKDFDEVVKAVKSFESSAVTQANRQSVTM